MPDPAVPRRFLVLTDTGDVVVTINERAGGLDADLLLLQMADAGTDDIEMTTPLKAFAAKMVDIIEEQGLPGIGAGKHMRDLLVREKATSELRRIEKFAKEAASGA